MLRCILDKYHALPSTSDATRRALVEQVIRSFFGALWNIYHPDRSVLGLHVLNGARTERAVAHIHGNHWYVAN